MLILKPIAAPALWGGTRFSSATDENIGQYYTVGATEKFDCTVLNGPFKGQSLSQIYQQHRELFATKTPYFPLLIAFVDAQQDLSIQIHPDDAYAIKHEHSPSGKEESWIFLEEPTKQKIVCGTKLNTLNDVKEAIEQNEWESILDYQAIQKGDIITIEPQTLHALGAGSFVYEIQQPVDLTYRFYDYQRVDRQGLPRELHLEKSLDVLDCSKSAKAKPFVTGERYTQHHYWTEKCVINHQTLSNIEPQFVCYSVVSGSLSYEGTTIETFQSFILSAHETVHLEGHATLIASSPLEQAHD